MEIEGDVREAMRRVRGSMARLRPGEADDIVQETMLRAIRTGVALDAEPWLRTVARRVAIDNSRRAREVASGGASELELMTQPSDRSPEDQVVSRETVGVVREALDTLPRRYREALVAFVEEDESAAGVAQRFGLSDSATWTLLCRARARLRMELERVGYAIFVFFERFSGGDSELGQKAAAAGAAVIAAVAIGGSTLDAPTASSEPVEGHAGSPVVPAPSPVVEGPSVGADLDAPAQQVQTTVPEVELPEVEVEELARYEVSTCLLKTPDAPIGVSLAIVDTEDQWTLGERLLRRLPEGLRYQEQILCDD